MTTRCTTTEPDTPTLVAWRPLSDVLRCVLDGIAVRIEPSSVK